jgi:L-threonylcarbamoyladenylate synthase
LIVARARDVATAAAGGHDTIGLRVPAHAPAHALLQAAQRLGVPGVAAPSANRFGRVSATMAAHVANEFGDALWVLDGGACPGGIESTIVDCSRSQPVLLRPGLLPRSLIEQRLGRALPDADAQAPRAPGSHRSHYAPAARVRLMGPAQLGDALHLLGAQAASLQLAVYSRTCKVSGRAIDHRVMPDNAADAARELFAVLREFDSRGAKLIWIETPPDDVAWEGVRDRLQRACAD